MEVARLKSLKFWEDELLKEKGMKYTVIQYVLSKRFSEIYNEDLLGDDVAEPIKMEFEIVENDKDKTNTSTT